MKTSSALFVGASLGVILMGGVGAWFIAHKAVSRGDLCSDISEKLDDEHKALIEGLPKMPPLVFSWKSSSLKELQDKYCK